MLNSLKTILLIAGIGATPLLGAFEPASNDQYAAIFPPDWGARDIVLAAASQDQAPLTFGRTQNIGVFILDDAADHDALRQAGALLILPADAFRGCLIPSSSTQDLAS